MSNKKLQKILDETAKIGGHTTEVNEGYQEIKEKMTDNLSTGNVPVADLNKASKLMISAHKLAKELPDAPQRKSALNMLGVSSPLDKKVSWKYGKGTYSGDLIPSMETSTHRYARTHNGKIKSLPKK